MPRLELIIERWHLTTLLSHRDSNSEYKIQNLVCCHYTIAQDAPPLLAKR